MKYIVIFIFLVLWGSVAQAQTFTFDCVCGTLLPTDDNCDVCNSSTQSRYFKGLLIYKNGAAFKWIEEPYTVIQNFNSLTFKELVYPNPESIRIELSGTQWATIEGFRDSVQCPCATSGGSGTGGHVLAENGTGVADRDTADFRDNDIRFDLTNTAGATQITATIAPDSVGSTEIATGAVTTTEILDGTILAIDIAANQIDSTKVCAGCLALSDINQSGASSGQVPKWNGSAWVPSTDNNNPSIPLNEIAYGTGSGITSSPTVKIITTGDPVWAQSLVLKPGITSDVGGILIDSVDADAYGIAVISRTQTGKTLWTANTTEIYGSGSTDIRTKLVNNSTDGSADAICLIQAVTGDPIIQLSPGGGNSWWAGVDNSATDALIIGYGASFPPSPSMQANTSNQVGIGGAPVTGKSLTVTGEIRVTDLTNDNPTGLVGADGDGDVMRVKLGSGLSLSNDTLTATGSLSGSGVSGYLALWNGLATLTKDDTLFWDFTNNRLGIGTTTPNQSLDIRGGKLKLDLLAAGGGIVFATGNSTDVNTRIDADASGNIIFRTYGTSVGFKIYDTNAAAQIFQLNNNGQGISPGSGGWYISDANAGMDASQASSLTFKDFGGAFYWRRTSSSTNQAHLLNGSLRLGDGSTPAARLDLIGPGATSSTYTLIATNSGGTTSTASLVVRDDNRVGIRTNTPQTPLNVVGTSTSSSNTSLLVEASDGTDNFKVRDDGVTISQGVAMVSSAPTITFGTGSGTGPTNDLCQGGANGFFLAWTTGTTPTAAAAIFTATLPKSYPNGVVATFSCGDDDCANTKIIVSGTGNNSVTLSTPTGVALTASTSYNLYVTLFGF